MGFSEPKLGSEMIPVAIPRRCNAKSRQLIVDRERVLSDMIGKIDKKVSFGQLLAKKANLLW